MCFRGVCQGKQQTGGASAPDFALSATEQKVLAQEKNTGLQAVDYQVFEAAIKRYGYTGRVQDTSLIEVQDDINLSAKQLDDKNSYAS